MAPATKLPGTATSNGVITDSPAPVVNRKKQKRRQKEAARRAAVSTDRLQPSDYASDDLDDSSLAPPPPPPPPSALNTGHGLQHDRSYDPRHGPHSGGVGALDPYDGENGTEIAYSDDEAQYAYDEAYAEANGLAADGHSGSKKKSKKKKKKNRLSHYDDAAYGDHGLDPHPYDSHISPSQTLHPDDYVSRGPAISDEALRTVHQRVMDPIWDSSSLEEKSKIRAFWIGLSEDERKSLVKIEKEAVLKKMKEQQKHSCSCSVCGRKRTAIEEELEVLYDAYYEELEQYQKDAGDEAITSSPTLDAPTTNQRQPQLPHPAKPWRGRIQELSDNEEDEDADVEDDGEYSDEDEYDDYSDEEPNSIPAGAEDILAFGRSLTVRGGILTVADDLLRNDGRKFIDMMEKLADRRMRRENRAFKPFKSQSHMYYNQHYQGQSEEEEDEYYEDDDEYESEDGNDEFDEEEDEMDTMTEQQRMQEGRRMFQIFAARMFEQRVLNAYREKVARERQDLLIAEMEEESRIDSQRDAKKARDAEKKKAKKLAQKQQKAEEKARKDAERASAEAAAKEAEAKKQEEQRRKREDQRKKREAEKKAQEEEKQRKEAEKVKRQQEERSRQQEAERKARDVKAEEKRRKDEARRKEREDREARENAAREQKAYEDKARREHEEQRASARASESRRADEQSTASSDSSKRPGPPATAVAVPPAPKLARSSTSQLSLHDRGAAPALPKTATPMMRPRESSGPTSAVSDPNTPDTGSNSKQSSPPRPVAAPTPAQTTSAGSMRGPGRQVQAGFPSHPMSPAQTVAPPPGMPFAQNAPFPSAPPGVNGFQGGQAPMMHGMPQGFPPSRPMFPQGPAMSFPHRPHPGFGPGPGPGPNAHAPGGMMGRGFPQGPGPNVFGPPKDIPPAMNARAPQGPVREPIGHSRQPSLSLEGSSPADLSAPSSLKQLTQPIARPAPIKRPDSTKPGGRSSRRNDDDETEHFGSSALLSDALDDEPLENRSLGAPGHYPGPPHMGAYDPSYNQFNSPGPYKFPLGWAGPPSGWQGPGTFTASGPIARLASHRPALVRRLTAQSLAQQPSLEPMEIGRLVRHVERSKPNNEPTITIGDIKSILDTEGDSTNGGGFFTVVDSGPQRTFVSWTPDTTSLGQGHRGSGYGLGEIGSPVPGSRLPAIGRH